MPHPKWKSESGKAEFQAILQSTNYKLDGDWSDWCKIIRSSRTSKAKVPLYCKTCKTSSSVQIGNFILRRTAGCNCSKRRPWKKSGGLAKLRRLVNDSRFEFRGRGPEEEDLHQFKEIHLVCGKCKVHVDPFLVDFFTSKFGCGCNNAAESRANIFLQKVLACAPEFEVFSRHTYDGLVGVRGGLLPFDLSVSDGTGTCLLIEIDGGHHFDPKFSYGRPTDSKPRDPMEHDLRKELHALALHIPLLRIDAEAVRSNRLNWNGWLQGRVESAMIGNLEPGIHRLGLPYKSNPYCSLRVNNADLARDAIGPVVEAHNAIPAPGR